MRKRSNRVALCIVGAAAFTLAGCQEEQVDAQAYPDRESCEKAALSGGLLSAEDCDKAFAEAQELHVETAPRYDSLAVCEEQHGEGACGDEASATGGSGSGSIFMPLLAGYLVGNMLSNRAGAARSQPLYRTPGGGFAAPAGNTTYSSNSGKAKLGAGQFARPAATVGKPPMTRATAASRGGFGNTGRGVGG
ncbi:DUF1190 domain-containing protein [Oceaniglobus trochenteri]|uniref:DUF1190 domain-containing protein n=1 Tax=Oceaniglobus trochenteri TaxID=2763260 RepID=UPI001CFFFEBC|nr:DUF1190 domain-containing protein [Oceaniglobus trochenteri]